MEHEHSPCAEIRELKEQMIEWAAKFPEYIKRLEKVEEKQEAHDKDIKELYTAQAETKIYVKQILDKIQGMESQLFSYLRQVTSDATEERKTDRKEDTKERKMYTDERVKVTTAWQSWGKSVVSMTIGALIAGVVVYLKIRG